VHRFVAEDAGGSLRQIAVVERRNRAEIRAHRTLFELSGKSQDIRLGFQLIGREGMVGRAESRCSIGLASGWSSCEVMIYGRPQLSWSEVRSDLRASDQILAAGASADSCVNTGNPRFTTGA
jgi:hypothetical protein